MKKKYFIDSYNYCNESDAEKEKFYREHIPTENEKVKTQELMLKLDDFVIKTSGEEELKYFHHYEYGNIQYIDGLGYVSITNYDRDEINVYGYGMTVEEVFIPILVDYEFYICENYEWSHRQELNKQFSDRFLGGVYSEKDYHGPFFFAELALQEFRKYYGDNIPEEIINYYEDYLKEVLGCSYKYDYETNSLVPNKEDEKVLSKNK